MNSHLLPRPYIVFIYNKSTAEFEFNKDVYSAVKENEIYNITFRVNNSSLSNIYKYNQKDIILLNLTETKSNMIVYHSNNLMPKHTCVDNYEGEIIIRNAYDKNDIILCNNSYEILSTENNKKDYLKIIDCYKEIIASNCIASDSGSDGSIVSSILQSSLNSSSIKDIRTSLYAYLNRADIKSVDLGDNPIIYPFGCNKSQRIALEKALTNSMSIIEGPPGTGKTQTILNIVSNIILQNKSVAIVANSNIAVSNIKDKLACSNYDRVVASLGNNANISNFFNNKPKEKLDNSWLLSNVRRSEITEQLKGLNCKIQELLEQRSKLSILENRVSEIEIEFKHLKSNQPLDEDIKSYFDNTFRTRWSNKKALYLKSILPLFYKKDVISRIKSLYNLIVNFGIFNFREISKEISELETYANYKFYEISIYELKREIKEINSFLVNNDEKRILDELNETSNQLFKDKIYRIQEEFASLDIAKSIFRNDFDRFTKLFPIVTSTTLSLPYSTKEGFIYDYLIIEEASQVDILKAIPCLSLCKNLIIIGDSKQLSHIVAGNRVQKSTEILEKYEIEYPYNYIHNSILDSFKSLYGQDIPSTLLKEHYRCHPSIIGFCNKKFYDNSLIVMNSSKLDKPFKIIETNRGERSSRTCNQRQIDETLTYISNNYKEINDIGIISPYREHADKLQSLSPKEIEADTIHRFQGREKSTIILNTISDEINNFIDNPNLINVAVSRAVNEFIVIKSPNMSLPHGSNIGDLIRYIDYTSGYEHSTIKGKVCSVFDILYKEYNQEYLLFEKKYRSMNCSPAEKIINNLLKNEILPSNSRYNFIDTIQEYRLADLIREYSLLSEDEFLFTKNNSRLDFLLYNKIDKSPILAIEVDGVSFHNNPSQLRRDAMKDSIMKKLGIPLIRVATNGHNEKNIIIEKLNSIMNIESF
ncbi:MAG: AAA domain-containing protein [Bacteroidales bacterium]